MPTTTAHEDPPGPPEGTGPLRLGAYHRPTVGEAEQSWAELVEVIERGNMSDLKRHANTEAEYGAWSGPIKEEYGGLEEYIRQVRLGWGKPDGKEKEVPGQEYFRGEWVHDGAQRHRAKCIPNDWPYAVPADCGHFVVWSISPMLHEGLFHTEDTPFEENQRQAIYDAVAHDGVRGRTGAPNRVVGQETIKALQGKSEVKTRDTHPVEERQNDHKEDDIHHETTESLAMRAQAWAGREVNAYVEVKWPEDQWETVSSRQGEAVIFFMARY